MAILSPLMVFMATLALNSSVNFLRFIHCVGGFRAYMRKLLIRLDIAFSDEGGGATLWVGHPFQFRK